MLTWINQACRPLRGFLVKALAQGYCALAIRAVSEP